jgi:hypothetical protein
MTFASRVPSAHQCLRVENRGATGTRLTPSLPRLTAPRIESAGNHNTTHHNANPSSSPSSWAKSRVAGPRCTGQGSELFTHPRGKREREEGTPVLFLALPFPRPPSILSGRRVLRLCVATQELNQINSAKNVNLIRERPGGRSIRRWRRRRGTTGSASSSVPSLCSSEAVTEDSAPRRDDGSALAEAERIKALLLDDQEQVRPPTSAALRSAVRSPARPVTHRQPLLINPLSSLLAVGGRAAGAALAAAAAGPHDGHPGGETPATAPDEEFLRPCLIIPSFVNRCSRVTQATAIGKAVCNFRKHGSKQIRNLVRSLVEYVSAHHSESSCARTCSSLC